MKNGVPYDVAFTMSPIDVQAHTIVFGELEGLKFNWATMRFEERKA